MRTVGGISRLLKKMIVGLHDAEEDYFKHGKNFPNLALMKISAWHKAQRDTVEWWVPVLHYDRAYSSKVFNFTPDNLHLPDDTTRGGTGYRDLPTDQTLPPEIGSMYPDYSIYPGCDYVVGYLTRGCPNHCRWCMVPNKEGTIRLYRRWQDVVRRDTDKLVLIGSNILACKYGIEQLESLIGSVYQIDLNQGMDTRLMDDRIASILARLKWARFTRFSCDQQVQIEPIRHTIELLGKYGVRPYRTFICILVTADIQDAADRMEALKGYKTINLYAQTEHNERLGAISNKVQLEFQQRYMYSGCYRTETWEAYCERKGFKGENQNWEEEND